MSGHVVVVGSINVDLSLTCDAIPAPGETVLATDIRRSAGGKGANQAVAAARAGGVRTSMVSAVGDDAEGQLMLSELAGADVDTAHVPSLAGYATGLALITVDRAGENAIVVASGANSAVTIDDAARELVSTADVVLAQLETPQAVVAEAARARRPGVTFILNAAPAAMLSDELAHEVDLLVVNEHEARSTAGAADLDEAVGILLRTFPAVLVTLGSAGSDLHRRDAAVVHTPAPVVPAVDTTAAGDTFCGVLAAALADRQPIEQAMAAASAAASLAVQRRGAQDSIPTVEETRAQIEAVSGGVTSGG